MRGRACAHVAAMGGLLPAPQFALWATSKKVVRTYNHKLYVRTTCSYTYVQHVVIRTYNLYLYVRINCFEVGATLAEGCCWFKSWPVQVQIRAGTGSNRGRCRFKSWPVLVRIGVADSSSPNRCRFKSGSVQPAIQAEQDVAPCWSRLSLCLLQAQKRARLKRRAPYVSAGTEWCSALFHHGGSRFLGHRLFGLLKGLASVQEDFCYAVHRFAAEFAAAGV